MRHNATLLNASALLNFLWSPLVLTYLDTDRVAVSLPTLLILIVLVVKVSNAATPVLEEGLYPSIECLNTPLARIILDNCE